jgi:hypothetical protein
MAFACISNSSYVVFLFGWTWCAYPKKKPKPESKPRKKKEKHAHESTSFKKDVDEASKSQNIKRRVKRVKNKKKAKK